MKPDRTNPSASLPRPAALSPSQSGDGPPKEGAPAPMQGDAEADQRLTYHQQKKRAIVRLLAFLLGQTLIFSAVNFYQIHRLKSQGLPSCHVAVTSSHLVPVEYEARVDWERAGSAAKGSLPQLLLAGHPLPCTFSVPPTAGQIHSLRLDFEIQEDCLRGLAKGILHLNPVGSIPSNLDASSYPISFRVKGLGEQWALVRYWLVLLFLAYVLAYVWCLFMYAAPSGTLVVKMSNEGYPRQIPLRMRRVALMFPWLRDTLSHAWIRRRLPGVSQLGRHKLMLFFDRHLPPLLELTSPGGQARCLDPRPRVNPPPTAGWPCGIHTPLHPDRAVVFWDDKPGVSALVYHEPKKTGWSGRQMPGLTI